MLSVSGRLRPTFIYMLTCSEGAPFYIKIGITDQITQRMKTLMTACPVKPVQLSVCEARSRGWARKIEKSLHGAMAKWRCNGEWFRVGIEDKTDFNKAWKVVFWEYDTAIWPLAWTHISTHGLRENWKRSRRTFLVRRSKLGRAYFDFEAGQRM